MSITYDKDFLKKYLGGICSEKEKTDFEFWLKNPELNKDADWMKEIWDGSSHNPKDFLGTKERIWQELQHQIAPNALDIYKGAQVKPHKKRGLRLHPFLRYASVILLVLVSILAVKNLVQKDVDVSSTISYSRIETLPNEKQTIKLSDGSVVTLNGNSSLEFLQDFRDSVRSVTLHGEAYFQVAKDSKRPFKVYSNNLVTVALGTSFNIISKLNQEEVISLTSGKVVVKGGIKKNNELRVFLNPGEELAYNSLNDTYQKKHFDYNRRIVWKDGILYFEDDSIDRIIEKIENWYGVKVYANNKPIKQWQYTGEFKNQTLENVMRGMSYSKDFNYSIKDDQVIIDF